MNLQQLYAEPDSWTQGLLARTRAGDGVPPDEPGATSWCLLGAAIRCYGDCTPEYRRAIDLIRRRVGAVIEWNNEPARTIDEVRDLVRELGV